MLLHKLKSIFLQHKHRLRALRHFEGSIRDYMIWTLDHFSAAFRRQGRPVGVHDCVRSYLLKDPAHGTSIQVRTPERLERKLPHLVGPHTRMPVVFELTRASQAPAVYVHRLQNIRYWGYYGGAVIGQDAMLIGDLSQDVFGPARHMARLSISLPPVTTFQGVTAILSVSEVERNFWHWCFDLLPNIDLLQQAGFSPENVDRYLINHADLPFQLETLALLGIPKEKIVCVNKHSHFQLETAVICDRRTDKFHISPKACRFLSEKLASETGLDHRPQPQRIYVTRANCEFRRLLEEDKLIRALTPFGFIVVDPASLTVAGQRSLFAQAEWIIGPHGSGMTNWVFAPTGCRVMEIMHPRWPDLAFWAIAEAIGLEYYVLMSADAEGGDGKGRLQRTADLSITDEQIDSIVTIVRSTTG